MKKIFLFTLLTGLISNIFGQITTSVNPSIAAMQALLQGNGVVVTGLTITCPAGAYATFNNGAAALGAGLNSGILLTTGSAANIAGPPTGFASTSSGGGGSALGTTLTGGSQTFDACYINFLITPSCATLSVNYVFASEEYPTFVNSGYNDVFGFVLSGPNPLGGNFNQKNIATVPGQTNTPVSIDNVNAGTNSAYFITDPPGLIYNGATTVLTASTIVTPCQTYTMTIGVWDDFDTGYDSGVFLDVNGLSCANQPTLAATVSPTTICGPQTVTLTATPSSFATGSYTWSAPASGGLAATSGSVVTANPTAATTYTVKYSDINTCPGFPVTQTVSIAFTPPPALPLTQSPAGAICAGQSVTLTANGGAGTYSWSPATNLSSTTSSVTIATPPATETYTVTKTVGTCVSSSTITVTVNASSTVAITPTLSTICLGQVVNLTATGSGPWNWTASSGANPPSTANIVVSPLVSTTYTVISGSGTCTSSAVASVSISSVPVISITPSLSTICSGQSATLTSSGSAPFLWTASTGANPPSASSVTVTPITTTSYTVLSGAGTCTASAVAIVSVSPAGPIAITPSLSTICLGESIGLSSSGAGPFVWTASAGTNPPSVANVTVTPSTTTTYSVISGTGTCTSSAVATVSIGATPPITITPSNTIICNGQSISLNSSGIGPFVWTASSGPNPSSTGIVSVSPASLTTYTVISGTGACTIQAVATVSVSPTLTVTITPSNTTICNGSGTTLTAGGATSYTWFPSLSSTPTLSVAPTTTTTYSLVGTDGICANTATAIVNVTTITTSVSASSNYYCIGVSPVSLTGSGATTYSWSPGSDLSSTSGAVVTATSAATTIYSVTGTTSGCSSTQTISITVPPISTITAVTANSIICVGGAGTTLTASGATTYTWDNGATTSTTNVNPTTTSSYTVVGQTSAGCFEVPAVVTVSVLPTINPILSASSPTVCLTDTVIISAPTTSGLTYTWQPTSAIIGASNTSSIAAVPPSTATVIYSVTISNGVCVGTNTIQLQVKTAPHITNVTTLYNVNTLDDDSVCVGNACVSFSATSTGSQPIYYQWYYESGIGTSSITATPEACYPSAGSFSVVATASNTCGVDTLVKPNLVHVFDIPVLIVHGDTTINIGESATVYASGGISYSWSPNVNGNTITCPTCSNTVVQPTITTQYIVEATNSRYCKINDTVTVKVDINCGDFFIPNVFSPNGDGLNDMINIHGRCISTFNLQIFNRWGEKVFETSSLNDSWDGTFRGQKMDTGVFVYKAEGISIDGQSFKFKGNITLIR